MKSPPAVADSETSDPTDRSGVRGVEAAEASLPDVAIERTPRDVAEEIVRSQPDDAGLDEILRALGFHRVVERGLADAAAGRVMSQAAFRSKVTSWLA